MKERKLKDKKFTLANIEVTKIRECWRVGETGVKLKDKMFCVSIDTGYSIIEFCKDTPQELFEDILFHLNLNNYKK